MLDPAYLTLTCSVLGSFTRSGEVTSSDYTAWRCNLVLEMIKQPKRNHDLSVSPVHFAKNLETSIAVLLLRARLNAIVVINIFSVVNSLFYNMSFSELPSRKLLLAHASILNSCCQGYFTIYCIFILQVYQIIA